MKHTTKLSVYLFKLTMCFERAKNIEADNRKKSDRYSSLTEDNKEAGYSRKHVQTCHDKQIV